MNDGGKFLAAVLLAVGIGGAWTFRRDEPPAAAAPMTLSDGLVRRGPATRFDAEPAAAEGARLSGTIERFAATTVAAATRSRSAGEYELTSALMPAAADLAPQDDRAVRYNLVAPSPSGVERAAPVEFDPAAGRMTDVAPAGGSVRAWHAAYSSDASEEESAAAPDRAPSEPAPARRHVVRDGDTLGDLAERYYGDVRRYRDLFQANADRLSSPEVLPIGAELVIPKLAPSTDAGAWEAPAARLVPQVRIRGVGP